MESHTKMLKLKTLVQKNVTEKADSPQVGPVSPQKPIDVEAQTPLTLEGNDSKEVAREERKKQRSLKVRAKRKKKKEMENSDPPLDDSGLEDNENRNVAPLLPKEPPLSRSPPLDRRVSSEGIPYIHEEGVEYNDDAPRTRTRLKSTGNLLADYHFDEDFRNALRMFDITKDGRITINDLNKAADIIKAGAGYKRSIPIMAFPESCQDILRTFDSDRDESVSVPELMTAAQLYQATKTKNKQLAKVIFGLIGVILFLLVGVGVMMYLIIAASKETQIGSAGDGDTGMRVKGSDLLVTTNVPESYASLTDLPFLEPSALDKLTDVSFTTMDGIDHSYSKSGYAISKAYNGTVETRNMNIFFNVFGRSMLITGDAVNFTISNGLDTATFPVRVPRQAEQERRRLSAGATGTWGSCTEHSTIGRTVCLHSSHGFKRHRRLNAEDDSSNARIAVDTKTVFGTQGGGEEGGEESTNSFQSTSTPQEPPARVPLNQLSFAPSSCFKLEPCEDMTELFEAKKSTLAANGYTQCVKVFGALLVAKTGCDCENKMIYGANYLAQLLDPNKDGVKDEAMFVQEGGLKALTSEYASTVMAFDMDAIDTRTLGGSFDTMGTELVDLSAGDWGQGDDRIKEIINHEIFLMYYQKGLAMAYPMVFGDTWLSIVCEAVKAAQCTWYRNDMNVNCRNSAGVVCANGDLAPECEEDCLTFSVPGQCYPHPSSCAESSCECPNFFYPVWNVLEGDNSQGSLLESRIVGAAAGNITINAANVQALLRQSTEGMALLAALDNDAVKLPSGTFSQDYLASCSGAAPTAPTPYTAPTPLPTSN